MMKSPQGQALMKMASGGGGGGGGEGHGGGAPPALQHHQLPALQIPQAGNTSQMIAQLIAQRRARLASLGLGGSLGGGGG